MCQTELVLLIIVLLLEVIIILTSLLVLLIERFVSLEYILIRFPLLCSPIGIFSLEVWIIKVQCIGNSITHSVFVVGARSSIVSWGNPIRNA